MASTTKSTAEHGAERRRSTGQQIAPDDVIVRHAALYPDFDRYLAELSMALSKVGPEEFEHEIAARLDDLEQRLNSQQN